MSYFEVERQDRRVEDSGNQDVSACQVTAAADWFLNQEPSSQRIQELALGYTGQEPDKVSVYVTRIPTQLCYVRIKSSSGKINK